MMVQTKLGGSVATAKHLRDLEIAKHQSNRPEVLRIAREMAIEIAQVDGEVCVDDIRDVLPDSILDNYDKRWFGAIFKDNRFIVDRLGKSRVARNHANVMCIYRLNKEEQ